MYAVIQTGGKQYRVAEGDTLRVELLSVEAGADIELDKVLMVADGDQVKVGTPYLADGKVAAKVIAHGRDEKVRIVKFRRRKHYKRMHGHRQHYTLVEITGIAGG